MKKAAMLAAFPLIRCSALKRACRRGFFRLRAGAAQSFAAARQMHAHRRARTVRVFARDSIENFLVFEIY
jgi:hypothetical protein